MNLREIYAQPGLKLSIEFFPPKTPQGVETLMKEAAVLRALEPSFCSVTYGAGGSTRDRTVEIVDRIRTHIGVEVMCHVTVVGQSQDDIRALLAELERRGLHNIIALRGDPPQGLANWTPHPDGFTYSIDLVREARAHGDFFSIAVAGFPETHPQAESPDADIRYLKQKIDAGADVVITQLFFDNDDFYRFTDRARRAGIEVPIVPGVLPILTAAQTRRFTNLCGARIPSRLEDSLAKVEDDDESAVRLGIDYATEQCRGLLDYGVPGLHFYALNRSRSVTAILGNLSLADARARATL